MNHLTPLAFKMRPQTLDDVIGQDHLVGSNGFLRQSIKTKTMFSIIFFGPPGCGKTTIAEAYARSMDVKFIKLNAVTSNKKDLEQAIEECRMFEKAFIIMDEVHRLNKDKQDILLPYVEDGTIYLLGATTANPYISINPAIRSRVHLLEVKKLSIADVKKGLKKAIESPFGLNNKITMDDDAIDYISQISGGDLRFGLNYLEVLSMSHDHTISLNDVKQTIKVPNYSLDKNDDEHYNAVSALQKSIRGSDVDAALYYLAKLCVAQDLESIQRRLLVTAYEDVGLANPQAVDRTYHACQVANMVGFPEAIIPLGFAVCDLALSPKSKASQKAISNAFEFVKKKPLDVLDYLKLTRVNVSDEDSYPYDRPDLWEKIQYLPEMIKNISFYEPTGTSKYEQALNANYHRFKSIKRTTNLRKLKEKK